MLLLFVEIHILFQRYNLTVYTCTLKSCFKGILQNLFMLTLSSPDDWCENHDSGSVFFCKDSVNNLIYRLLFYLLTAVGAMRDSDPRIKKTQVIVDFRYRSDS